MTANRSARDRDTTRKHGASRYRNGLCHDGPGGQPCDVCKAGNAELQRAGDARRAARLAADPSLRPHGDVNTYSNWLCRCDACTAAWSVKMAARWRGRMSRGAP